MFPGASSNAFQLKSHSKIIHPELNEESLQVIEIPRVTIVAQRRIPI